MKKNTPRSKQKRPTATIDLKAKEVKKEPPEKTSPSASSTASSGSKAAQGSASKTTRSSGSASSKSSPGKASSGKSGADNKSRPTAKPKKASGGGGGFISHLLASIIGAVLGIFSLSYANNQNMLPSALQISGGESAQQEMTRLGNKIRVLERRALSKGPDTLGGEIASLASRIEQAEASLGGSTPGSRSLAQKVARLEATLGDLEQAARTGKGGRLAGLTAVTKQLSKSNKQSLALKTEMIKVREEQTAFREDLTTIRSAQADFQASSAKISNELAKMRNSTAKIVADASRPPDVSPQINPIKTMLSKLTAKINGVIDREAGSKAEGRDIALALSLGELKRAVNEGVPFEDELARVLPHAPKSLDLSLLKQYAGRGLVTTPKLRSTFSSFSHKVLALKTTAKSGSFVDQILANAKSMVQVRPTGLVEGDTTGAVLSRMEYKLSRNDLAGSLKESVSLDVASKDILKPWLSKAHSRHGGDTILRALEDKIRNSLAGVNSH